MKKVMVTLLLVITMTISTMGTTCYAATKETTLSRGVKYLCWSKDVITWTYTSSKISAVDKYQQRSGVLVNLRGISKEKARSTSTTYSYLCKHTLLAGAELNGVTIGYSVDIDDRCKISTSGTATWYLNV